jgi:hypothetical protein
MDSAGVDVVAGAGFVPWLVSGGGSACREASRCPQPMSSSKAANPKADAGFHFMATS